MIASKSLQWLGNQVINAIQGDITKKLEQAGAQWLAQSRALAPIKTGFLREQEGYRVEGNRLTLILGAPYDIFQEYGTRNIRPHPHVRPALNAIGRIWGSDIHLDFNAPFIASPIYAHKGGFVVPKGLTGKQRLHVQRHLAPVSKRLHRSNVKRAGFHVRRSST